MARHVAVCLFTLAATAAIVSTIPAQATPQVLDLITQLKDKDESVRLKAAKELGKLKEKAKEAIPALSVASSSDADEDVRAVAKKSLEAIKDATAQGEKDKMREVIDPLVKDLKGKNLEKRIAALDKLAELGTQARDAGADVVEFGILKPPSSVQEAATSTLEKIDPESHKLIVTVLFDGQVTNRLNAVQSLEALGRKGKSGMPALKYHYTQLITTERFAGQQAGIVLHAMTKIAPDDKVVIETVLSLVSMPVPLQRMNNLPARSLAIDLLPELKTDKMKKVSVLISALNDSVCRAQAAKELGKLGADAKDALPVLTKLKVDADKDVRDAVSTAIELIKP